MHNYQNFLKEIITKIESELVNYWSESNQKPRETQVVRRRFSRFSSSDFGDGRLESRVHWRWKKDRVHHINSLGILEFDDQLAENRTSTEQTLFKHKSVKKRKENGESGHFLRNDIWRLRFLANHG